MIKKVTITEIAKLAGCSIGTVDRALHDRPGINKATKKRIVELAKQHGYRPNRLSRSLARNKTFRFGAIMFPIEVPFQIDLFHTIRNTADELKDFGIHTFIHSLKTFSVEAMLEQLEQCEKEKLDGLILCGLDSPEIVAKINQIVENGIPVITFNSDVPKSKRACFVGQNLYQSGCIAADLMGRFLTNRGNIFVIQGSNLAPAHIARLGGFLDTMKNDFPDVNILEVVECSDSEDKAYKHAKRALQQYPDLNAIYNVASGSILVGKAIRDAQLENNVRFICYDYFEGTAELLQNGTIDATILQDPQTQGKLPLELLYEMVAESKKPEKEFYYTKTEIMTKSMI